MTIYNINFGIGWASSGVEYAQMYRAKLLRAINAPMKFVFLEFMSSENLQTLTENIGFNDDEVIWMYQYFTDVKIAPTSYTVDDLKATIHEEIVDENQSGRVRWLNLDRGQNSFVTCYLKDEDDTLVDCAEFVIEGKLVRKDYYSYVRIFSEYYAPYEDKAKLFMRHYYNEDGSVAYTEYIDGKTNIYLLPDETIYSEEDFVAYFFRKLNLTADDIVIYDRASKVGQAMMQNHGESKQGVVVHAEHFSENATDDHHILWNNYYEYQFMKHREIDFYIAATDRQKDILAAQFKKYLNAEPKIFTIPVGSLEQLRGMDSDRKPYSMVTASRLASEKHIDWLVRAAVIAKREVPELTLDIYGEGGERALVEKLIKENEAEDYIRLLGHVKLDDVYEKYDLFVAASTSEGFGLTLLEAVGSGLGMLGFDVNYGNPTFIRDGENGYLIPIDLKEESNEETVQHFAEHMVKYFNDGPTDPHQVSYDIARPYLIETIQHRWKDLIEEVRHG